MTNVAPTSSWASVLHAIVSRKDPKTPMSFYTRAIWMIIAGVAGSSWEGSGVSVEARSAALYGWLALGTALLIWVAFLNWYRPEHLLYGAETHFEKWKIAFGSDQGAAAQSDLANLGKARTV
jgi:hypothetical protein